MLNQHRIDLVGEPAWVSRLAGQITGEAMAQMPKEIGYEILVEDQAGREFDQQRPKLGSKQADLSRNRASGSAGVGEPSGASDFIRDLRGKPESGGTLAAQGP
nr:hypothetical protein [Belnapia sp. F-4-1]